MKNMISIVHSDYEKISDELMRLPSNWVIKFNVILNKYSDKYGRQNYHKEVKYTKNGNNCLNINRSFDYYLSIENLFKNDAGYKEFIMISVNDIYMLKFVLDKACLWFTSNEHSEMFAKKDGKIFMPRKIDSLRIPNLPMGKYIEIEPFVNEADNRDQIIGVRMFFNSSDNMTFINVSRLFALKYFIDTFNMYQSAQLMINYLQRPEYGTNMYTVSSYNKQSDKEVEEIDTYVPAKKNNDPLSYFDRISKSKGE